MDLHGGSLRRGLNPGIRCIDRYVCGQSGREQVPLRDHLRPSGRRSTSADVLRAVVRLLSDASAVHACFVYLRESDPAGERLVLRAASTPVLEPRRPDRAGEGRRAGVVGGRAARACVHPRAGARGPAGEVRARARRGAVPVARLRPRAGQGRDRDRRDLPAHRGAARVHRGRGRVPRLERVARRRCDRERATLRRDEAPDRGARAPDRARRDDRARRVARRRSCPRSRAGPQTCCAPSAVTCISSTPGPRS